MRLEPTGERFALENKRLAQQALDAAAAAMHSGTAAAGPHVPTPLDDAHRVVELERARVEHPLSGRRNDPVDTRPKWKEVEASRRWGPPTSIPTAPPIVQVTREQLEAEILALNEQLGKRHREDKDLAVRRDQLTAQLHALQK